MCFTIFPRFWWTVHLEESSLDTTWLWTSPIPSTFLVDMRRLLWRQYTQGLIHFGGGRGGAFDLLWKPVAPLESSSITTMLLLPCPLLLWYTEVMPLPPGKISKWNPDTQCICTLQRRMNGHYMHLHYHRHASCDDRVDIFLAHFCLWLGRRRYSHQNAAVLICHIFVCTEPTELQVSSCMYHVSPCITVCFVMVELCHTFFTAFLLCRALLRLRQWQHWLLVLADQQDATDSGRSSVLLNTPFPQSVYTFFLQTTRAYNNCSTNCFTVSSSTAFKRSRMDGECGLRQQPQFMLMWGLTTI